MLLQGNDDLNVWETPNVVGKSQVPKVVENITCHPCINIYIMYIQENMLPSSQFDLYISVVVESHVSWDWLIIHQCVYLWQPR